MMRRREFIWLLGGAAAWPFAARAQQGERMRRIGVLMSFTASDPDAQQRMAAFEQGLRDHGWIEGRNLLVERRWSPSYATDAGELRRQVHELVQSAPDVILSNSTPAALAFKEQGGTVPVVFAQVTDPVGAGLVASFTRPGGNITGFTSFEFSLATKWLEMLKVVAPHVSRVALVFNPRTAPYADVFWRSAEAAASSFGAELFKATGESDEIGLAIEAFAREPNGALIVLPDVSTMNLRGEIIGLAERHRLPAIYPFRYFALSGGLMSYGTDVADVFRRAAGYVDRILKGAKAGELPVQAPNKYELVINLKAAAHLGIALPPLLFARADEIGHW